MRLKPASVGSDAAVAFGVDRCLQYMLRVAALPGFEAPLMSHHDVAKPPRRGSKNTVTVLGQGKERHHISSVSAFPKLKEESRVTASGYAS